MQKDTKSNKIVSFVIVILFLFVIFWVAGKENEKKDRDLENVQLEVPSGPFINKDEYVTPVLIIQTETYTYNKFGISLELPKDFIPHEEQAEGGPTTIVSFPNNVVLSYYGQSSWYDDVVIKSYQLLKTEVINNYTYKVYGYDNHHFYSIKNNNQTYEFSGSDESVVKEFLKNVTYYK